MFYLVRIQLLTSLNAKNYSKEQIFTFYANQISIGHGRYGIAATGGGLGSLFDLEISYFQLGGTYLFEGDRGRPFMMATIGASRFEPDNSEYDSETFFAFSIGGGYKLALTPRIGLRLEGRVLGSVINSDTAVFCRSDEVSSGCLIAVRGNLVWQWEMGAGLRIRF